MKTSLIIEPSLLRAAKEEARKHNRSISETIVMWARLGQKILSKSKKSKKPELTTVNLGSAPQIDLTNRRDWLDLL